MRCRRRNTLLFSGLCVVSFIWYLNFFDADMASLETRKTFQDISELSREEEAAIYAFRQDPPVFQPQNVSHKLHPISLNDSDNDQENWLITSDSTRLNVPGIWTFLPHLSGNQGYLQPRLRLSAGKKNANIVIGIPTIKRPMVIYILETLQSIFENMSEKEAISVIIVVFIAEPWNIKFETELIHKFKQRFSKELASGVLEVVAPHAELYPDLHKLKSNLGDSKERVMWRSKQNLDYAFLMMYASARGNYYIQLEDDVSTTKGFVTTMEKTITQQQGEWFLLKFSSLGFIGRLFRRQDVPQVINFLLLFFSRKPCDWLMEDFMVVKLCPRTSPVKSCKLLLDSMARLIKPTLFQHQGLRSSLEGTINKLKDIFFDSHNSKSSIYSNPPTKEIICTITAYEKYDVHSAYRGKNIFWGKTPHRGDLIEFLYNPPIKIKRLAFQSGHKKWPLDIINNATVEIMPEKAPVQSLQYKLSQSNQQTPQEEMAKTKRKAVLGDRPLPPFYVLGHFSEKGSLDVDVPEEIGKAHVVRICIQDDIKHWVILEQIVVMLKDH